MAHQISTVLGVPEVFTAGLKPWHSLGANVEQAVTAERAMGLANLDWQVEQVPVLMDLAPGSGFKEQVEIPDRMANIRRDFMGRPVYLGTVGKSYRPIQNTEAFEFMDALVGEGQAVYETAGAIKNGKRVWILVRLPEEMHIGSAEDKIQRYLLLVNGHDGGQSLRAFWSPVRVVCANTLNAALRGSEQGISVRHTEHFKGRLEEARKVLGLAQKHYEDLGTAFNRFFHEACSKDQAEGYFRTVIPGIEQSVRSTRADNIRARLMENFTVGDQGAESARGTLWGAYNAITRYVDHDRTYGRQAIGREERRFESVLWGSGKQIKQRAFDIARGVVATHQ